MSKSYFHTTSFTPLMVNPQTFFKNRYCNFSFPRHFHDEYLIQIIKEGQNDFYCQGKLYKAYPGDTVLINPSEIHNGNSRKNEHLDYNVFYLDPNSLTEIFGEDSNPSSLSFSFSQTVVRDPNLFCKIAKLFTTIEAEANDEIFLTEQYLNVIQTIARNYSNDIPGNSSLESQYSPRLKILKEYIHDNLGNKLLLAEMSRLCFTSPFHLLRIFTKFTGITLYQFILVRRIEKAKELLKARQSIHDVTFQMGFSDQSHFTRSFKKMVGLTPRQYQLVNKVISLN